LARSGCWRDVDLINLRLVLRSAPRRVCGLQVKQIHRRRNKVGVEQQQRRRRRVWVSLVRGWVYGADEGETKTAVEMVVRWWRLLRRCCGGLELNARR